MLREQKKLKTILIILIPFVFAVLIMTPRLFSAQFGFLDDGAMLGEVRTILTGDFSMQNDLQAGRFRPFYWFYFTLIFSLAGMKPFWFYIGHLILLLILLFQIRLLMKNMGATTLQTLLTSLVSLFSIPIIENFYTLSKGEPLQLIFILAAILNFQKSQRKMSVWRAMLIGICILSAIFVKETALTMAPLALFWLLQLLTRGQGIRKSEKQNALMFLIATVAAIGFYYLLRLTWGATPLTGGTYTERYSLNIQTILDNAFRWITLFAFYFHYLIPVILILIMIIKKRRLFQAEDAHWIFFWIIWIVLWVISLIPWGYAEVYYLLPFSFGNAVLIGLLSPMIIKMIRTSQKVIRLSTLTLLVIAVILFVITLPTYRTHARAQLAIDKANQQMLVFVIENTPENGKVFMGLETEKEYVQIIKFFLNDHYGRSDITYSYVSVKTLERLHWYPDALLILPHVVNQPNLLPRTGVDETFTMTWAQIIMRTMEGRLKELQTFHQSFRLSNINLPIVACSAIGESGFCINPDPLIDLRTFTYGWDVQIIKQKEN